MSTEAMRPEIGQWYSRSDKGELFQVVGRDETSRSIEIQTIDGEIDEIEPDEWTALPLERAAAPEDWTAPIDDVETDDLGYSETAMSEADWTEPLQSVKAENGEPWEALESDEERDTLDEGVPAEPFIAEVPEASPRLR